MMMSRKTRRKQIIKCYKFKVKRAREWLLKESAEIDRHALCVIERSAFNLVYNAWFGGK